ncbi:hypothetical protein [Psychroserpens sp.]|uniref:hypothetical protein n=1 Tax=Psychroserpens sp. TaxID=2020870 RepID=UPI002B2654F8|nr:hypothetical protein [Psychroserpens sp.]
MIKNTYFVAILLCTILSYGQQITFHENTNYRATVLLQSLDDDAKNLLLESKTEEITKIDIFNDDFSEIMDVYSNKAQIDLNTLPIGHFVIQARVGQKRIIMYLEKNEDAKLASSNQDVEIIDKNALTSKQASQTISREKNKDAQVGSSSQKDLELNKKVLASQQILKKPDNNKNAAFYWVVSESNSGFGSSKSMRLEYKDDVDKLISKVKLELKSSVGKNNKLLIYEIYNRSKFMSKQLRNSGYYQSETSEFFNVVPIYTSRKLNNNLTAATEVYANEDLTKN